jgi:hypothetical protein
VEVLLDTLAVAIIAKWFSRKQFPLVGALYLSAKSITYVMDDWLKKYDSDVMEMVALSLSLFMAFLILWLPIDPIDCGLIINETARNLTSVLHQQKEIMSVYSF